MRLILIGLLPAALVACSDSSTTDRETMPAPGPTMEEAAAEAETNSGTSSEMPEPMEGEWTTSTDRGDPSVSFGPEDETLLTLICRSGATEDEAASLVIQRALSEDQAGESIDFLTSAGNVSIDAVPLDMETPMIGGSIDPASNGVATLVNANDAIRVRSGSDEIVVPADEAMKTLVSDCRPEPEAVPEGEEAEGETDAEGEDGEAIEEETEE